MILYIMLYTHHYTFVKTNNMYNTESEPYLNYGFGVIMMYKCIVINSNKLTTLVNTVDNTGAVLP